MKQEAAQETGNPRPSGRGACQLKRLAEAATPGPWLYRPKPHDDWGFVRSVAGEMVAIGMRYLTDKEEDVHRANGTDPRGPNAKFIAAANPAAVLALLAERDRLRAALARIENINNGPDQASGEWRCLEAAAIARPDATTPPPAR